MKALNKTEKNVKLLAETFKRNHQERFEKYMNSSVVYECSGAGAKAAHDELVSAGAKFIKSKGVYKIHQVDFEIASRVTKTINSRFIKTKVL